MATKVVKTIFIVGPTASGKSSAAMSIAMQYDGEIICADSRTVYVESSIGTAKPTRSERSKIKHYGLDLAHIGERFTTSDFKRYATDAIEKIHKKNKLAIVVGGTGLYIDALLFDFEFGEEDADLRKQLSQKSIIELQAIITQEGYPMPRNNLNKRHLIRTIETKGQIPKNTHVIKDANVFGIMPSDEVLRQRINDRVDGMYHNGFLEEVKSLLSSFQPENVASLGIGYASAVDYLQGQIPLQVAKERFKKGDWHYARRQRTWFRRHAFIAWSQSDEECVQKIKVLLGNTDNNAKI